MTKWIAVEDTITGDCPKCRRGIVFKQQIPTHGHPLLPGGVQYREGYVCSYCQREFIKADSEKYAKLRKRIKKYGGKI